MSDVLQHVHVTHEAVASQELSPPHPPREETPEYQAAHHFLIYEKDAPCIVCGVRHSTLSDPKQNPYQASELESHHTPIERSLLDAVDWRRVHEDFPSVYSQATLEKWVDSPENLAVICDIHHRSPDFGIHHLTTPDFSVQKYLLPGYRIVASAHDNLAQVIATDEQIEQVAGIEQQVDAQMTATPAAPAKKLRRARKSKPKQQPAA